MMTCFRFLQRHEQALYCADVYEIPDYTWRDILVLLFQRLKAAATDTTMIAELLCQVAALHIDTIRFNQSPTDSSIRPIPVHLSECLQAMYHLLFAKSLYDLLAESRPF